jgi:hypothetical protein
MSPLDEARALVGGDGPAAERVAAVVAERDDLRTRLAEAEKDRDAFAARYRDACAERERAEMQRDVARTERDVLEMQLAERDAVLERIERALGDACTGDLASDVERLVEEHAVLRDVTPDGGSSGEYVVCAHCSGAGEICGFEADIPCPACDGAGGEWRKTTAEQPRAELGETDAGEGE